MKENDRYQGEEKSAFSGGNAHGAVEEAARALGELGRFALETFEEAARRVVASTGMRADDACRVSADLVGKLLSPMLSQVDPGSIGETERKIRLGIDYLERVLRRYRPDLQAGRREAIVERLVCTYPSHGFVIDLEELTELGVPVRFPNDGERDIVERLASLLPRALAGEGTVLAVTGGGTPREADGFQESEDEPTPACA